MHLQPITIPVGKDHVALIDADDYDLVSQRNWFVMKRGYAHYARANYKKPNGKWSSGLLMHRLILGAPKGIHVDHINGNGLDNRRANIRLASMSQNLANRGATRKNTSGFKGVYWQKNRHKWMASIRCRGHQIHLGYYLDPEEAAKAYDVAAKELFGEFSQLNFPS